MLREYTYNVHLNVSLAQVLAVLLAEEVECEDRKEQVDEVV